MSFLFISILKVLPLSSPAMPPCRTDAQACCGVGAVSERMAESTLPPIPGVDMPWCRDAVMQCVCVCVAE